jgi:oligopeptide transport system ATP-binding protein
VNKLLNNESNHKVKYKQELVDNNVLVSLRHVKKYFTFGSGSDASKLKAVHNVSFDIKRGECFGLVGESGCGKTTTGRCIIRLYDITSGSIYFKGYRISGGTRWNEKEIKYDKIRAKRKIADLKEKEKEIGISGGSNDEESEEQIASEREAIHKEIEEVKSNLHKNVEFQKKKIKQIEYDNHHVDPKLMSKMQMIFQDPIDSLDPRMTVEEIIGEGLKIQGMHDKKKIHEIVCDSLDKVGLIPDYCSRYPHEFSGGQRQRIGIARALVMNPEFLICDEPISALDVSIRAQIINLLNDLKDSMNLTLMFIAHDLSVVKYFCDRIAVMYYGEIVEIADSDELFRHPLHPYTKALLSAIPKPDPLSEKKRERIIYDPKTAHDYSKQKPTMREILPGHTILANDEEFVKYQEEIKTLDAIAKEKGGNLSPSALLALEIKLKKQEAAKKVAAKNAAPIVTTKPVTKEVKPISKPTPKVAKPSVKKPVSKLAPKKVAKPAPKKVAKKAKPINSKGKK